MDVQPLTATVDPATGEHIYQIDPNGAYVLIVSDTAILSPELAQYIQEAWTKLRAEGGLIILAGGGITLRMVARDA